MARDAGPEFHFFNDESDVERALTALRAR